VAAHPAEGFLQVTGRGPGLTHRELHGDDVSSLTLPASSCAAIPDLVSGASVPSDSVRAQRDLLAQQVGRRVQLGSQPRQTGVVQRPGNLEHLLLDRFQGFPAGDVLQSGIQLGKENAPRSGSAGLAFQRLTDDAARQVPRTSVPDPRATRR